MSIRETRFRLLRIVHIVTTWLLMQGASNSAPLPVISEAAVLIADDGTSGDRFGMSVDLVGDIAIIGAPYDDGVGFSTGSAYLVNAKTGEHIRKLTAPDQVARDEFGIAVAIDEKTAIVGAHYDEWPWEHPNNTGGETGSAYLFSIETGQLTYKLTPSDGSESSYFGRTVAIDGSKAVVGSPRHETNRIPSGSAYVFDTTTGTELHKLLGSDNSDEHLFGAAVDIDDDIVLVGAPYQNVRSPEDGIAYIFNAQTGQELRTLTASNGSRNDRFGASVALDNNIAIIGAPSRTSKGSAYLFDLSTGQELFVLTASDGKVLDKFGSYVAIHGNLAIVSAPGNESAVFVFDIFTGRELYKFTSTVAKLGFPSFGHGNHVAMHDNIILVGAPIGDGSNWRGAVYSLHVVPEPPSAWMLLVVAATVFLKRDFA